MTNELKDWNVAYFRRFPRHYELRFRISERVRNTNETSEIIVCKQETDTISSLFQSISEKISKPLNPDDDSFDCALELYNENIPVDVDTTLVDFSNSIKKDVVLIVADKRYEVLIDLPLVKHVQLPNILYANTKIQPSKFSAFHADRKFTKHYWYKSKDKINWLLVGDGYVYRTTEEDLCHYLKFVCIPTSSKGEGPMAETISVNKVQSAFTLPLCPFEQRHSYTRSSLKGAMLRVVSYNTLARKYSETNSQFPYCPEVYLSIEYRKRLLLREILGYNADIICLQEIDNKEFSVFFKPEFIKQDYAALYNRKGNRIPEGLACFYRKSKFSQISWQQKVFSEEIQTKKLFSNLWKFVQKNKELRELFLKQATSLQMTVLKSLETEKVIVLGNTHLYYHPEAGHVRLIQIYMTVVYLNQIKKFYSGDKTNKGVSVILCGDFNSDPASSLYKFITERKLSAKNEDYVKISAIDHHFCFQHNLMLQSAYGKPKYTNYTDDYKGCLDYIFYEEDTLSFESVVPLPTEEELSVYEGLPNEVYPSDHMALIVDLKFKD